MSFMENTNEEKKVVNNQGIQLKQLIITILWNIYIKYPLEFMKNIINSNYDITSFINGIIINCSFNICFIFVI